MDAYKKAQERLKREKEEAKKASEEEENYSPLAWLLNLPLYLLSLLLGEDAVNGMNPRTEVAEDPLQERRGFMEKRYYE
ncbi:MAG: hypothetical protein IJD97_04670 [Clostridia bacterium]|nr:hypothetical protein [Clostridia bacterium]